MDTNITVESSSAVRQFVSPNSRSRLNIVEEARSLRRDNAVEAFTEQGVREYKDFLKFCA